MLSLLRVANIALIERLEVEFGQGLNVLTGETGSGKTIVLEALGLVFGERARPGTVRKGAQRAEVEAVFDLDRGSAATAWLERSGLASPEPGELLVRREVPQEGRGRAWINGRLATVSQLAELGETLAAVQAQHQATRIVAPAWQREMFDAFGRHDDAALTARAAWRAWQTARARVEELLEADRDGGQRLEFLRFQLAEIDELAPCPGEENDLRAERSRLGNVEALRAAAARALVALSEGADDEPSALDRLGHAQQALADMQRHDPAIASLADALDDAVARLDDVARQAEIYAGRLEGDPERLDAVNQRLDALHRVARRHGGSLETALAAAEKLREEAAQLENRDSLLEEAREEECRARRRLDEAAAGLTALRRRTAARFGREVAALLRALGMAGVRFDAELAPLADGPGADGAETVRFLFGANSGEDMQPLADVASGGELSRVMLALHTLTARRGGGMLHVFDEIDAGLSGKAAVRMANALADLADGGQVLCITHQPTVAARAARHIVVEKRTRSGRTETVARVLEGQERRTELARLLDGAGGEKSLELAAEMLSAP